ncbi:unnamed protein product [Clavelina lepadiformis]|uniref:Uncharacterized protein n=1 Tax=Clavelina lepadiformis TaxID=159417 RepID=A0ABP0G4J6_CLALP
MVTHSRRKIATTIPGLMEVVQLTMEDLRDGGFDAAAIHSSMESGCVNQVDISMELFGSIGRDGMNLLKKLK